MYDVRVYDLNGKLAYGKEDGSEGQPALHSASQVAVMKEQLAKSNGVLDLTWNANPSVNVVIPVSAVRSVVFVAQPSA